MAAGFEHAGQRDLSRLAVAQGFHRIAQQIDQRLVQQLDVGGHFQGLRHDLCCQFDVAGRQFAGQQALQPREDTAHRHDIDLRHHALGDPPVVLHEMQQALAAPGHGFQRFLGIRQPGAAADLPAAIWATTSATRSPAVAASEEIGVREFITSCAITRMTVCQAASSCAVSSVSIFCSEIRRWRIPPSTRPVAAALSCSAPLLRSIRTIVPSPGLRLPRPVAKASPKRGKLADVGAGRFEQTPRRQVQQLDGSVLVHRDQRHRNMGDQRSGDTAPAPRAAARPVRSWSSTRVMAAPRSARALSRDRAEKAMVLSSNATASRKRATSASERVAKCIRRSPRPPRRR